MTIRSRPAAYYESLLLGWERRRGPGVAASARARRRKSGRSIFPSVAAGRLLCRFRTLAGITRDLQRRHVYMHSLIETQIELSDLEQPQILPRTERADLGWAFCVLLRARSRVRIVCVQDDTEETIEGHLFAALKKTCLIQV